MSLELSVLCAPTVGTVHVVGIGGAVLFVVVAVITAVIAGRAAKAVEGASSG